MEHDISHIKDIGDIMNIFFNSRIYTNQSFINTLYGQQRKTTRSQDAGCSGTRDTLTISASGKEKLVKNTNGRTHNTNVDKSIDLKSYIASAQKTNQKIIDNAGTQINAKTSEYMSTGKAFRGALTEKYSKLGAEAKTHSNPENYIHAKYFVKSSEIKVQRESDYDIVFFGDSVFGNYQDFASIPGVIGALTKASVHNRAIGGSSATQLTPDDKSFPSAVQRFLSEDTAEISGEKKLCFVINYGLNDYFTGYTVEQYRDGLQAGVQSLQDAYPDAEILIASSNFITAFDNGTAFNNDLDEILNDYVTGAEETAAAMNVFFLNTNEALQWNPQTAACYLVDAVHPNEEGRFLFGTAIIKALDEDIFSYPVH